MDISISKKGRLVNSDSLQTGADPGLILAADIDGDRDQDIVILDVTGRYLSLYINSGNRQFKMHAVPSLLNIRQPRSGCRI